MGEGVIFRHTVEAFLGRVVQRKNLLSAVELRELGLERARDVDLVTWVKLVKSVAKRMSPGKSEEKALEDVGREMVRGFADGMVGRGLFLVLRLLGPKKALGRMMDNYRTADSMTVIKVTDRGPSEMELEFNSVGGMPTYVAGVLHESLSMLQVAEARVDLLPSSLTATRFLVTWMAPGKTANIPTSQAK
jgi:uncharacterized protein (TIGR02265 family)